MTTTKDFKEMTFNDFIKNQTENIFFKFMDFGRKGIEMGSEELVLNVDKFQITKYDKNNKNPITEAQQKEVISYAVKELTDSLITQGTKGFEAVIVSVSAYVANIRMTN